MEGNPNLPADPLRLARYTSAAATAIYLYDIFITLDLEVEHIWRRLCFDWPSVLYMINRYLCLGFFLVTAHGLSGFHGDYSDSFCKIPFSCIGFTLAYFAWTGIITMRVTALWGQNKVLVRCINVLWVCVMTVTVVVACLAYNEDRTSGLVTLSYNRYLKICTTTVDTRIFKANPIAPATYELFLTILTVIKVREYTSASTLPMLGHILARDGVAYFSISTTLLIINAFAWQYLSNANLFLLLSLSRAIGSTVMSRLVLNLRATYSRSISRQSETGAVSANVTFRSPFVGERGVDERPDLKQSRIEVEGWSNQVSGASQATLKNLDIPLEDVNAAPITLHLA